MSPFAGLGPPPVRGVPRPLFVRVFSLAAVAAGVGLLLLVAWVQGRLGPTGREPWVDDLMLAVGLVLLIGSLVAPPFVFAVVRRASTGTVRRCADCGTRLAPEASFCIECGWRTPGAEAAAQRPRGPEW